MATAELVIVCQPPMGEPFSVRTTGFASLADATRAVAQAMDEHRSLALTPADDDAETEASAVVVNVAAMTSVRVTLPGTSRDTGQYL
jgi:hypothetical protein